MTGPVPTRAASEQVGYAQLSTVDPAAWRATGTAWASLAGLAERRAAELSDGGAALRAGWSGQAAGSAGVRLSGLRAELVGLVPAAIETDQVLAEFAARLVAARARLAAAVALAATAGVLIDRWGRPHSDPARVPADRAGPTVLQVTTALRNALDLAATADREAADRLGQLSGSADAGWAARPPPHRPAPHADPHLVHLWWAGLTPAERRWLVVHEPELVGRLDGVPPGARDQANRSLLGTRRAALLARWERLLARVPRGPLEVAGLRGTGAALAGLDALAARLDAPQPPRAYLLGLEVGGEGRAMVALGNPDRAAGVLTYVPGMTAGLDDVTGELGRAARVLDRCAELAPGEETSAVLWLDYDAPDFLHEAARDGQARAAGDALHRFQEGLRATHDGPPARQTVLGHSYGSLVVGTAARDHGLAADALVFVGSPGVGVAHATDLGVPPGQVWASTAPDDVIRLTRPPGDLARQSLLGASPIGAIAGLLAGPGEDRWFGRDPAEPSFGGRTFPSGRHGHTGYWHPANPALDGMARIVLGR
ncbi:alpha/beta hydrolase [Micromonospora sp. WMMD1082]|uniref:alpha/beta hydrolase n=1 Tax=Micromonospora sp. WMMD1082 TaxID=3016104 RepID=UPI0024167324|nr:alpha/beta hydrolase [Micromonospora sp. WMMD1082]MDG4793960.1 alpha/beta hydrolase [Micromonospora sp. WMMD1082]